MKLEFTYKLKKRYPYNKQNDEYYCEVRTKAPGAHILIIVYGWNDRFKISMNGPAHLSLRDLEFINDAVCEANYRIKGAQDGGLVQ